MTVRTQTRRGTRYWIIDIRYTKRDGKRGRFRHDAEVQTSTAARAEDRRRMGLLATTGLPFDPVIVEPEATVAAPAVTFAEAVADYLEKFAPSHLKPSTVHGYKRVLDSELVPRLGALKLAAIDASHVRAIDGTSRGQSFFESIHSRKRPTIFDCLRKRCFESRVSRLVDPEMAE